MKTIKKYIEKDTLGDVIRAKPDDNLGSALNKITSSHQPVFVFKDDEFKGLVYVSYALFKNRMTYQSNVSSALTRPPYITADTKLYKLAEYMLMTRLHTLPVFDNKKKIVGTVSIENILQDMLNDDTFLSQVAGGTRIQKPVMMTKDASVKDVYQTMKREKVSRVVVTDDSGKLVGIVSRVDISQAFVAETPQQRFGSRMRGLFYMPYYDQEKEKREKDPITVYYTVDVFTVDASEDIENILKKMIQENRNSVVILKGDKPTGFISRSDILQAISDMRPEEGYHIKIPDPKNYFSKTEMAVINHELYQLAKKVSKRMKIKSLVLTSDVVKNSQEDINQYKVTLNLTPIKGKPIVGHAEAWDIKSAVQEAVRNISAQIDN